MGLQRLERGDEPGDHPNLTLVAPPTETDEPDCGTLRVVGLVRSRTGEPVPDARLDWWHPAENDTASTGAGDDVDISVGGHPGTGTPDGTTVACGRGTFDLTAGDADEHLRVVVRADGYATLVVRLVPLSGLPPISPPIARSGRAPLAVRAGASGMVEAWCEFLLSPAS